MSRPSALDVAPPFERPDYRGSIHTLDEYLETRAVLLVFHRGTW